MSDEIGRVIRRDLDRLPLLPEERWVPSVVAQRDSISATAGRAVAFLGVVLLALWTGTALGRLHADGLPGSGTPDSRASGLAGAPIASTITREDAVALVRARTEVGRIDRIEAKLLTFDEYVRIAGAIQIRPGDPQASPLTGFGLSGDPAKRSIWIVAASGEIWPNGRTPTFFGSPSPAASATPYPPYRWGLFLVDAAAGQLMTVGDAGVAEAWPAVFDALPDHPVASITPANPTQALPGLAVSTLSADAMTVVLRRGDEIRRVDRIEVKLMTLGELRRAQPAGGLETSRSDAPVWVVAVAGDIIQPSTPTEHYAAAVYTVDANTGLITDMRTNSDRWPAYFDLLPNHPPQR